MKWKILAVLAVVVLGGIATLGMIRPPLVQTDVATPVPADRFK